MGNLRQIWAPVLAPTLKPGVVIDNTHKRDEVRTNEAAGATLHDLPPYSPNSNPTEQRFAKLKALLRKNPGTQHPRALRPDRTNPQSLSASKIL
jgi:hypothetical protein